MSDSNLISVARTFARPPVATLPVGWYRASAATFDLDSVMPCRNRWGTSDLRLPVYNNANWFHSGNNGEYEFGWASFCCATDRPCSAFCSAAVADCIAGLTAGSPPASPTPAAPAVQFMGVEGLQTP